MGNHFICKFYEVTRPDENFMTLCGVYRLPDITNTGTDLLGQMIFVENYVAMVRRKYTEVTLSGDFNIPA